jgi:hypothetical protein
MGRGRKPKWETEEERKEAIKESKMKYYKKNRVEILQKQKDKYNNTESVSVTPIVPKKTTVYNPPAEEEVEEIYFEPFEDDSAGITMKEQ